MKKKNSINTKILKTLILLIITLFIIAAFVGIYGKNLNTFSNLIPDYNYTIDIAGVREFKLMVDDSEEEKKVYIDVEGNIAGEAKLDDEGNASEVEGYTLKNVKVKANKEEVLNSNSYEKTKNIIENRLNFLGVQDYKIRLDRQTGDMTVEMKQDENTDENYSLVATKGNFEVKDYQNGIILMDNSYIKSVTPITNSNVTGAYSIYLQVTFNEEGENKLKEISNKYNVSESDDGENIKYISMELDGTTLYTTYFNEEWTTNYIYIPISENVVGEENIRETHESASKISNLINSGKLPVNYVMKSDNFIKSDITNEKIDLIKYSVLGILIMFIIILLIIFKTKGLILGFVNIGFVAILSIVLRILSVEISISGIIALLSIIVINLIFIIKILINSKKGENSFRNIFKKYNLSICPVILISLVYTLANNINLISIGMILFWGIIVFEIYNILVTKIFVEK